MPAGRGRRGGGRRGRRVLSREVIYRDGDIVEPAVWTSDGYACAGKRLPKTFVDITGRKFGRLTVLRLLERVLRRQKRRLTYIYRWECLCECGRLKIAGSEIKRRRTCSCGCLHSESVREHGKRRRVSALQREASLLKRKLRVYAKNAEIRGVPFLLTEAQFVRLVRERCMYCGEKPASSHGIDRIDNTLGYTQHNSAPCCAQCNRAKSNLDKDTFLDWVTRVHTYTTYEGPDRSDDIPECALGE